MSVSVKICGLKTAAALGAAVDAGAAYVGFVFYPRSPRAVTVHEAAALVKLVPSNVMPVGLFVDPTDDELSEILKQMPLRIIQLHGSETPERVAEIKKKTGLKVMKAIPIRTEDDLKNVSVYEAVADMLLFDAKPPEDMKALPGGNALVFDWGLLHGKSFSKPWMLAGGLNIDNLVEAVRITGAKIIDVSSGVEDSPGNKKPDKIRALINLTKEL